MQESVQEKAPERPAQAGQLKASTEGAVAPPFVDNRPSTAAQLRLAHMVQAAPRAIAQRRQMSVINGPTAQLEDEDEPLQSKAEPLQRVPDEAQAAPTPPMTSAAPAPNRPTAAEQPVQQLQATEAPAPVQYKADPGKAAEPATAQFKTAPVHQFAFVRTWGDEQPAKAVAEPPAGQAEPEAAAEPQAAAKKPGFFERMKNGVKNVAGKVGRALLNWSGQGKPPAGAAAKPQRPGAQPAPVQAPAGPKVYVPNEKRVSARRVPSRAPIGGRADAVAKTNADMKKSMLGGASLDAVSAETKASNAAPAAANPAAVVAGVIANRMRSSAPALMRQGLATKMGPLAAAEEGAVAGKLTANSYAVAGQTYKGEGYADAAAKAANVAAKQSGA